jgi:Transglycosylase SLT domain
MTNKVGIGIDAQFDTSGVEQQINALGQKIAAANKVQFTPFSGTTKADLDKIIKQFDQLRKIQGDLNKRMQTTGQGGANLLTADWDKLYSDPNSRARQMRKAFEYSTGSVFQAGNLPPSQPPQPPGQKPPTPNGPGWQGVASTVTQAGLRAAGGAGGVAAGALGTGMSAGFGAGLMGLMGGMLALGAGRLVSGVMEKVDQAERNNIGLDTLKRTLGDVNVSFAALKSVVHSSADNLKITYDEAGRLATQFTKLGNVTTDQYKTLGDELDVGVGMSRAFGLDPSQGVGVMGQMSGLGITSNTQESRRFALLIGETIGKSGAFAKADEVMDALGGYAAAQTRSNMGAANVAGYAGMFSGLVGSGIPGMDPAGAASLLGRINGSLSAGGAKGEASQFFTSMIGARMGLDPFQTQILREGGAFATNDEAFGEGSTAKRFGISGPGGDKTFLQSSIDQLRQQYGKNKGMLAMATANHLGINMRQAMGLLSVDANQIGEMQGYGDLSKLSGNGIGNLSKALYGSEADRQGLASTLLGRKDVSGEDKDALRKAMGTASEREMLAKLTAQYDQERTQGSDIRDSKTALDNIKTNLADKLVPMVDQMRHGIMHIAGGGKKSPKEIMAEVMALESKDKVAGIKGSFEAQRLGVVGEAEAIRVKRNTAVADLKKNFGSMTPEEIERAQKNIVNLSNEYERKSEDVRKRLLDLQEREAKAIEAEVTERDKRIEKMRKENTATDPEITGSINQSAAEGARLSRVGYAPAAAGGGGRSYTSSGGAEPPGTFDDLFVKYGKQYGVDPRILKAIASKESNMRPGAVGGVNRNGTRDYGLMQHNSAFLAERGLTDDWRNPERSIEEAAKLLRNNIRRTGSVRSGVRAYNGSGPDAEAYAADIMSRVDGTKLGEGTPLPGGSGGGRGGVNPSYNISADDITVRVVDANGRPMGAPQQIQTRVQSNWRPSMGY